MMFSIIIPVYNVAPYLRECLDSVLAAVREVEKVGGGGQRKDNLIVEIICVDDGSTDGSGEMLDEYVMGKGSDPLPERCSFRVIHQQNAGVSAARNAALDVATGEWICFVDADDWIEPAYLADFIAREEKADVTIFPPIRHYDDGFVDRMEFPATDVLRDLNQIESAVVKVGTNRMADAFGWTWNKIWRREAIGDVRFPLAISFFEDEVFAFRAVQRVKSLQICNKPYYHYRSTAGGLTQCGADGCERVAIAGEMFSCLSGRGGADLRGFIIRRAKGFLQSAIEGVPSWRVAGAVAALLKKCPDILEGERKKYRLLVMVSRLPKFADSLAVYLFLRFCRFLGW